jgi:hypothetical protein
MLPVFTAFLPMREKRKERRVFDISGLTLQQSLCQLGNIKNGTALH